MLANLSDRVRSNFFNNIHLKHGGKHMVTLGTDSKGGFDAETNFWTSTVGSTVTN